MESAISLAQSHGLPEGNNHPPHNPDERWTLVVNWRQAIAQQLLTPASDTAAVAWKKATLAGSQHEYNDIKTERLERPIDDDVAFLAAHPTRRWGGLATFAVWPLARMANEFKTNYQKRWHGEKRSDR